MTWISGPCLNDREPSEAELAVLAAAERRIAAEEAALDDRLARGLREYIEGTLHTDGRPIPGQ